MNNQTSFDPADFTKNALVGLALFADCFSENSKQAGNAIAGILSGNYERYIRCAVYFREIGGKPETIQQLNEATEEGYQKVIGNLRASVQYLFNEAERIEKMKSVFAKGEELKALQERLRKSNQPHPQGTVDELAKRFNVSKSEIRRRKTEGTLNELFSKEKTN